MAIERLKKQEVFKYFRPEQVDAISNAAEVVKFSSGDTVYYRGARSAYFYIVLSGQVALRLPGKEGVSVLIDELGEGAMFGSCVSFAIDAYALNAQCTKETEVLKISAGVLKELMDEDPRMGYAIQSRISEIYFQRYIETMQKLQAIVMHIPIEAE